MTVDVAFEDAFRAEVTRVRLSPEFRHAPVLSRLLAFLARETLAGRGDALKAYGVAVDGLGRSPDFDATADSYPRVQVGRLRKALETYYSRRPDQLVHCLHVPSGSYRLRLSARSNAYPLLQRHEPRTPPPSAFPLPAAPPPEGANGIVEPPQRRSLLWWTAAALLLVVALLLIWARPWSASPAPQSPQVLLKPTAGGASSFDALVNGQIADGLRRSWIMRLVVGQQAEAGTNPRYRIETQVAPAGSGSLDLFVRVIDTGNGSVVWSTQETLPQEREALKAALAPVIARLSSPFGVIARSERARLRGDAAPGYACLLLYGEYYRVRDPALRSGLAKCIVKDGDEPQLMPAIESARAVLVYASATNPADRPAALRRARAMIAATLQHYWDSPEAHFANASLAFYAGDCARAGMFSDRAIAANPYSPNAYGSLGVLTYQCDRAKAREMLQTARVFEPDGPANFRIPLLLMVASGESGLDVESLAAELHASTRSSPGVAALGLALVAAAKGDREGARRNWDALVAMSPGAGPSVGEIIRPYILSDQLRAIAVAQLAKAGISDRRQPE